jgi:hypothetical protein
MNSREHLNETELAPGDLTDTTVAAPGYFTAAAWVLGLVVLVVAKGHDGCTDYAAKPMLNALLVIALGLQVIAVVAAMMRVVGRVPGSGASLGLAFFMSVVAVPAAVVVYLAINGFICGSFMF